MRQCAKCGIKLDWNEGRQSCIVQRPKVISELLCYPCYHEKRRILGLVSLHCQRAKKYGLPATLTVKEWLATEQDFQGKCAYCRVAVGTVLEHFIPITCGGGTVKSNCVPACDRCNKLKWHKHPDLVTLIPQEDMKRVHEYLMSFEKS